MLRDARIGARLSQADLARRIRESGHRRGDPNGCTRGMVQRWEAGTVAKPQARYLLALEDVLGQSAGNLGFAADAYGVDRSRAIADAGLDTPLPAPDAADLAGALTGIWLSEYEYDSTGRGATFTNRHRVRILHRGAHLTARSLPRSRSAVSLDLWQNGQVVTGTWAEVTETDGYYRGATYHGGLQMLVELTERRMTGKWVGFGRDMEVNVGPWSLTLIDSDVGDAAIGQWSGPAPRPQEGRSA